MGQSTDLIGRPLYGSPKRGASFVDSRLIALAVCLLESHGVRHAVVGAVGTLKASDR